ncbi:MAG: histidine kinase [Terriglobales bacterium]
MSLGSKTTALLAAVVSTALVAACLLLLHYHEDSLKQAIFEGVDGEARIAAYGIGSFVEGGQTAANVISATVPAGTVLSGRMDEVETHLKQMSERFPVFGLGLFILDKNGKFLADYPVHPELRGQSFAFREYFQRTMLEKRGVVSKPYKSTRTGLPVLTFTAPVRDAKGQIVAVLGCSVDLQEALGSYRRQTFGKTGYLYVFDRSRRLILHPDDARQMTYVESGKNRVLEAAIEGYQGADETVNSVGVPMLLAVRDVPNTGWIVGVQVTQREAYAPIKEARARALSVSGLAILLVIVIGTVAIRRVSRPLQQLERAASQISAELEKKEIHPASGAAHSVLDNLRGIRSRDEIGLLAAAFLQLATKLDATLGSLQRSAADWERTFDSVREAVVILDAQGRIVRANQTAEAWFGSSTQGQYGYEVILGIAGSRPSSWPDVAALVEQQPVKWSQSLEKPRGIFDFSLMPVSAPEGRTGAVLVINDITQRVQSEEQSREIAKAFHIAERTLSSLEKGFNQGTSVELAKTIHEETGVGAVAITDKEKVLAFVGYGSDHHLPGIPIPTEGLTRRAVDEKQVIFIDGAREHFVCPHAQDCPLGSVLIIPLQVDNDVIGTIRLYEPKNKSFLNINKTLGEGITSLLSNQLLVSRYQQQKNLLMMSELKLIHAQINPHFLFNTLNTIIAIIRKDAGRARELLIHLSNFFRKNLKRSEDVSTLQQELDHVSSYLKIEKARFEDRLVVEMDIDPELLELRLPTFTLQPLIENAVKHGISNMLDQGVARIRAYRQNGLAIIEIEDNAGTFSEANRANDGLGITLVDRRIKNLMGSAYGTSVTCVPNELTRVTIRMPAEGCRT